MTSYDVKQNKATGYDFIPQSAVKLSADVLCYPLSTLINYVLNNSKIPQQWKLGEVTPVFKKDCSLDKSNYRPQADDKIISLIKDYLSNQGNG